MRWHVLFAHSKPQTAERRSSAHSFVASHVVLVGASTGAKWMINVNSAPLLQRVGT